VRTLAIALSALAALLLAATALAVLPQKGRFAGTTNAHAQGGFQDGVVFSVINNGHTLHDFSFGTLGCFGIGAFPVGVDPYALASSVGTVGTIQLAKNGTFLVTTKPHFSDPEGTTTTAIIQGSFSNAKTLKGTITISQVDNEKDKCGPTKMTFSAAPGVADDSDEP
jgi:hypothetical protein